MRVWLCLLGLTVPALCDSQHSYVDQVIDYRTKYRKFLPDYFTDVSDPSDESTREVNLTKVYEKIKAAGLEEKQWSQQDSQDDPNLSESKREWMKRFHQKQKNSESYDCDPEERRKYEKSLERRFEVERNTTDVYEDDLSDLWDLYMANKTLPPGFNLEYSPPLMNARYRAHSLSMAGVPISTTQHWLMGPLTGDDGVQFDIAMAQYKRYNVSKNDPAIRAAAERFLDNDMQGKKLNKSKDVVRYFIDLRRRLGVTLNWTKPTISISKELQNMQVPNTQELYEQFDDLHRESNEESVPDCLALLREHRTEELLSKEKAMSAELTTQRSQRKTIEEAEETVTLPFVYQFDTIFRPKESTTDENADDRAFHNQAQRETTETTVTTDRKIEKVLEITTKTVTTERKTTEKVLEISTKAPERIHRTTHKHVPTSVSKHQQMHHNSSQRSSNEQDWTKKRQPEFQDKYLNSTVVKFLHRHKNKFLIGGIACFIGAKIFTS